MVDQYLHGLYNVRNALANTVLKLHRHNRFSNIASQFAAYLAGCVQRLHDAFVTDIDVVEKIFGLDLGLCKTTEIDFGAFPDFG